MNEVMNASRYDYMQTSGDATFDEGHGHAHGGGAAHSAFDRGTLTNWCVPAVDTPTMADPDVQFF